MRLKSVLFEWVYICVYICINIFNIIIFNTGNTRDYILWFRITNHEYAYFLSHLDFRQTLKACKFY